MAPKAHISATIVATALLLVVTLASAKKEVIIPDDYGFIDEWMELEVRSFDDRMDEAQAGIGKPLDESLVDAEQNKRVITVSGDFKTVSDAVNSVPKDNTNRTIIKIGPGVYKEKITVDRSKPFITFFGDHDAMPTLTFDGRAAEYGTVNSASVAVDADYFMAVNIIFENTSPRPVLGVKGAQAVAMKIGGDKAAFYSCKIYGFQDTLCDHKGRHFFKDCFIQGTVDFIFGGGKFLYLRCEMHSVADGLIAITAQARKSRDEDSGFSFVHCNVTGSGKVLLGRAWMPSSLVVYSFANLDSIVEPRGWDDFGKEDRHRTLLFGEHNCKGPGANMDQRVPYCKALNSKQARRFTSTSFIEAETWLLPPPKL
ncbi:hypothetical protein ACLOJK_025832 [Asimina triloba]